MNKQYILKILDKSFVLDNAFLHLFSKNSDLYVRYHNQDIKLISDYYIGMRDSDSKNNSRNYHYPISFKYNINYDLIVDISHNFNAKLIKDSKIINTKSEIKFDLIKDDKINLTIRNQDSEIKCSIKKDVIEEKNTNNESVRKIFNESNGINSNKYYNLRSDKDSEIYNNNLSIMKQIHKIDGVNFISNGSSRKVFRLDNTNNIHLNDSYNGDVIKVAKDSVCADVNSYEYKTWKTVKSSNISKLFCPVVECDQNNRYLIMKYAERTGDDVPESQFNTLKNKIMDAIDKESLKMNSFDLDKSNVGIYNNNPVLIDYPYGDCMSFTHS